MSAVTRAFKLQVLPLIDAVAQRRGEQHKTTCRKGCAACCYQVVYATEPEALLVAETLLRDKARLQAVLPMLRAGALLAQRFGPRSKKHHGEDLDKVEYWRAQVPCTFLDPETRLCTVYAERPVACRTYYVVSAPELCSAPAGTPVLTIDVRDLAFKQLRFAMAWGSASIAPLANAVLWGLFRSCHFPHPLYRSIRDACLGVIFPDEWTRVGWGEGEPERAEVSP